MYLSKRAIVFTFGAAGLGSVIQLVVREEPLYHLFPNFLVLTSFSDYAPHYYQNPEEVLPETSERAKIPEMQASEYSYERMERLTEGFTRPIVVKGLFHDTYARRNWTKPGYLRKLLGNMPVGVYKRLTEKRSLTDIESEISMNAAGFVAEEILTNEHAQTRFVFPQMAHAETNGTDPEIAAATVRTLMADLDVERIRPGFGTREHSNLIGQQFFMGRRIDTPGGYKGLNWHMEPGNNWFVQVIGKKRWFVMAPEHSALMLPKKSTSRLIVTSDIERIDAIEHRMPVLYGDVEEGDMLFNPEWWWHRTEVYPGVSISVPMREFYLFRTCWASPMYSAQLIFNILYEMKIATFIWPFMKRWAGFA